MSYKGLDRHLVEKVQAADVRQYLLANDWRRVPDLPDEVAVFRRDGDGQEVVVPMTPEFPEHQYRRMAEAISDIAGYEERAAEQVLNDLLTGPADVVRFRVDDPSVADGTILIEDGLNLFGGARKALLASACSVVDPQAYYARLSRAEASTFIKACRIASEPGSFIARVICPLDAVPVELGDEQLALTDENGERLAPEPFTRKVTGSLMKALDALVTRTNRDEIESLFESPAEQRLSANLCDALLEMQPAGRTSSLTVASHWAARRRPVDAPASCVELRSEHFDVVEQLANRLRPQREAEESSFIGTVIELSGSPGSDGRPQGQVTLRLQDGDDLLTARVNLKAEDYATAGQAHFANRHIKIWGTLHRRARIHQITAYDRLTLLDDSVEDALS
ncbi:hypothetical protein FIV42_01790 [Persicimonas caeni]|uniref:Uncharacterized protein n=1 Tax=Persicimonas caeni TaxID=2292766 RepID=A0A4Y6PMJ8_PERCE|nr:hypothetical protein [Persicimonas caeni]QDG49511.1 hypothetical protein FIV42_01790 [Persicimonas caeni]QED30732.1 hypothetical protein FRD00_01785 [Persicimonas caeni]